MGRERRNDDTWEAQMAVFEAAASRVHERSNEVLRHALRWLDARARRDDLGAAAVERTDPPVAKRLRAFEKVAPLPEAAEDRAALFGRLHEGLLLQQLTQDLREAADEACPLCKELGVEH